jgi:hypothetical protein
MRREAGPARERATRRRVLSERQKGFLTEHARVHDRAWALERVPPGRRAQQHGRCLLLLRRRLPRGRARRSPLGQQLHRGE